jgi:hypothetical protein
MRELARVPFNLRILAQLLDANVNPEELHPITTQLELLDRYWQLRVLEPQGQADAREALLRRVCQLIVDTRSMRVQRADIQATDAALLPALADLLSSQVIVESTLADGAVDRDVITFGHHVLLDYAAARLLLRRSARDVVAALATDRQMAVLIRPSLDLHLRWLWERNADHSAFWDLVLALVAEPRVPQLASIVGTGIAAEMTRTLDDLAPLVAALRSSDEVTRTRAETVLVNVLASVDALGFGFAGESAGPWAALAAELSGS